MDVRERLRRLTHKSPETNNSLFTHGKPNETASCRKNILRNVINELRPRACGSANANCSYQWFPQWLRTPVDEGWNDLHNLAAVPVPRSSGKHYVYLSNNGHSLGTYFTTRRCDVHDTMPAHTRSIYGLFPRAHACTQR